MGEKFGGIQLCKKSQWFQGFPVLLRHALCFHCPMFSFLCFLYSVLSPGLFKPTASLPVSFILHVSKDNSSYRHTSAICTHRCSDSPVFSFQIQCWPEEPQMTKSWCLPGKCLCCSALINFPRHLLLAVVRDRIQAQRHLCQLTPDGWLCTMQLFTCNPTVKFLCYLSYNSFLFLGENITLKSSVGIFITMNPGYAGRTELPENLKALFRQVCYSVLLWYTGISSLHLEYISHLMLLALVCSEVQFLFASEFLWKNQYSRCACLYTIMTREIKFISCLFFF